MLLLTMYTGRNQVSKATLKLATTSGIQFKFCDAVLDGNGGHVLN